MMAARIGATRYSSPVFHRIPEMRTPIATAESAIVPRSVIRPSTSAVSAESTTPRPAPSPKGRPDTPAARSTDVNDIIVATVQTRTSSRRTGMPSIERAVRPLGGRPQRDARLGEAEHEPDGEEHERSDHDRDQVVAVEDHPAEGEAEVERGLDGADLGTFAPCPGEDQGAEGQDLRQAERGDGQHEPGRAEEPPDDEEVGQHPDQQGAQDADQDAGEPRPTGQHDEEHGEGGGEHAEVALREVHDPVRPPDEADAHRAQRPDEPEDRAGGHGADRHREEQSLEDQDRECRPDDPRHGNPPSTHALTPTAPVSPVRRI